MSQGPCILVLYVIITRRLLILFKDVVEMFFLAQLTRVMFNKLIVYCMLNFCW